MLTPRSALTSSLTFRKTADSHSIPAASALLRCAASTPSKNRFPAPAGRLCAPVPPPGLRSSALCCRESVAWSLAELPAPAVQQVRVYFQAARHFGYRYPLFQPPDGGQLKLLRELPA